MTGLMKKKRKFSDAKNKAGAGVLGGEPALRHPVLIVGKKSFSFRRLVSGAHKVGISIRNH